MKKYSLAVIAITAVALVTGSAAIAQDTKDKDTKDKEKSKDKMGQYDEIIIRKKTDKDDKVVIEIKDGEVMVNGKPMEDFDNENISVRRNKTVRLSTSPFRRQSGTGVINYDGPDVEVFGTPGEDRAFLGVSMEDAPGGARIRTITKGSAAEKAGLQKGDIITKIDKEAIEDHPDVSKVIRAHKPDDKVAITIKRDGKEQTLHATLDKSKSGSFSFNSPEMVMPNMEALRNFNFDYKDGDHGFGAQGFSGFGKGRLGIKAQDTEEGKGVKVLDVNGESAAEKAGIKEDDVITEFDGKTVNSADELAQAAQASREKASVAVKILRNGKAQTIEIKTPKKLKTANL